jgi:hypothetical protein
MRAPSLAERPHKKQAGERLKVSKRTRFQAADW